jgi:hypothetical protein
MEPDYSKDEDSDQGPPIERRSRHHVEETRGRHQDSHIFTRRMKERNDGEIAVARGGGEEVRLERREGREGKAGSELVENLIKRRFRHRHPHRGADSER